MMAMHDGGNEEKIKFLVEDMHADIAFVAPNQSTSPFWKSEQLVKDT